ncbi:MAG TPA: ATP-binding cassette domain-containing protein, partial [Polyangiaceae bacterium]|nr:ATP-binding cassette domain-containing protein [Polyangiaceae bacterium]
MTDALERVGFGRASRRDAAGMLDARVDELSVGQRQRVALARLLCRQAPILLLDEPDANLDDAGVAMLVALVRELARQRTVVLVAHSPDLLAAADRVVRLEAGRVVGESTGGRSASA